MAVSKLRFFTLQSFNQNGKEAWPTLHLRRVDTSNLTEHEEQETLKSLRGEGFVEVPDQIAKRLINLGDLGLSPLDDLPASR
jgi:hypothetical protein